MKEDRLPHLLLYGPPGTGKTSTILAVAKQIYSPKEFNSMVLEVCMYRIIIELNHFNKEISFHFFQMLACK